MFHRYWSTPGFLFCLQPDTVTGDIVFVLQQKEHPKFKRKGDDIFYEHTLSLTEALCGFQFILTHLDGRQLLIKSQPGEVVKPGKRHITILCVPSLNNMSYYYFFLVRVFFLKLFFGYLVVQRPSITWIYQGIRVVMNPLSLMAAFGVCFFLVSVLILVTVECFKVVNL